MCCRISWNGKCGRASPPRVMLLLHWSWCVLFDLIGNLQRHAVHDLRNRIDFVAILLGGKRRAADNPVALDLHQFVIHSRTVFRIHLLRLGMACRVPLGVGIGLHLPGDVLIGIARSGVSGSRNQPEGMDGCFVGI